LVQKEIQTIGDQIKKMNGDGGVNLYPLPLFCNLVEPVKKSCDFNACSLCGMWYTYNNFLAAKCGHTFHPWCVAIMFYLHQNVQLVVVNLHFQSNGVHTWGIQCCPGIDFSSLTSTPFVGQENTIPFKDSMLLLFRKLFPFFLNFNLVHLKFKS